MLSSSSLLLLASFLQLSHATPVAKRAQFSRIIAFGDDFTDNGQGSYAAGITGDPTTGNGAHLWGANTWTDGLVAVSYLAQNLGIPLAYDFAYGSSGGAEKVGSVCNNTAIPAGQVGSHAKLLNGQLVPDALSQVKNYTGGSFASSKTDVANTLHFFWTGNDDLISSLGWVGRFTICDEDTLCHPGQQTFINGLVGCITSSLNSLVDAGAQHILVPNLFPKQFSPWQSMWISSDPGMIADFGGVITQVNAALKTSITNINAKRGTNIVYFDAYSFLNKALTKHGLVQGAKYSKTCPDGCNKLAAGLIAPVTNWSLYWTQKVVKGLPDPFYWMTENMPSTTVHKALAGQMAAALG